MDIKPYIRKAQYYETDQMGIIHHANYIHWMEEARVHFMEQMGYGYEKAVEAGINFALTGISCQYKSMVRFGEEVEIKVSVSNLGSMKMTVKYDIRDAKSGKLRAVGESEHCYFDGRRSRPVPLKSVLPELFELFSLAVEA